MWHIHDFPTAAAYRKRGNKDHDLQILLVGQICDLD
jgi:hypothetical protein